MLRLALLEKDLEVRCGGNQSQTLETLEKPVKWANGVIKTHKGVWWGDPGQLPNS